ncbi:MAG: hypothetical protein SFU25_09525 [Candidatus Caenarcaniphilales bacterium]|nr:hypothetical protein [Candidatus Caenarcaniphilales bacterium]
MIKVKNIKILHYHRNCKGIPKRHQALELTKLPLNGIQFEIPKNPERFNLLTAGIKPKINPKNGYFTWILDDFHYEISFHEGHKDHNKFPHWHFRFWSKDRHYQGAIRDKKRTQSSAQGIFDAVKNPRTGLNCFRPGEHFPNEIIRVIRTLNS